MIGKIVTLVSDTPIQITTGGVGTASALLSTTLTDVQLGGQNVTTTANRFPLGTVSGVITVPVGRDDLWAVSHAGGPVNVLYPENG